MKIWEIVLSSSEIRCLTQKKLVLEKEKISKMRRNARMRAHLVHF